MDTNPEQPAELAARVSRLSQEDFLNLAENTPRELSLWTQDVLLTSVESSYADWYNSHRAWDRTPLPANTATKATNCQDAL
jgi:hypothetical protein